MNDALILAKRLDFDVFNALDILHNEAFLKDLKAASQGRVQTLIPRYG